MSTEDLLGKLDEHAKSTAHLHAALHDHVKGDDAKVAQVERLTQAHAAATDRFHDDAQVLVRPTGEPQVPPVPQVLVRPTGQPHS